MSQLLKRGLNGLFAVAVSGALLFGSVQTVSGFADEHCPNDGQGLLGSCSGDPDCQIKCEQAHPGHTVTGDCVGGCCHCLL